MTIEVPPNMVPELERCVTDVAKALGEPLTPALRRCIEVTILTRGLAGMRNGAGDVAVSIRADRVRSGAPRRAAAR